MNYLVRTLLFAGAMTMAFSCGNNSSSTTTEATEAPAAVQEKVVKIGTATAGVADVPQTEVYTSTVQANVVNNIAPQGGERIQKINVEVGDFVRAGQVLAEMDAIKLQQTKLKLANDSTEFWRLKNLYEDGGVSKSDLDAIELAYQTSKASYKNLLENTILRAPVSGVITERNYDKGDMYSASKCIYVLQQITPVKLHVGISESDYTLVKKGDSVEITVDAIPGKTFTGRVNRIYPTMDPVSHTFTTEIIVPNSDRVLRPGMYANVKVTFGVNHSVVIPDDAVVKQQGSGQRSAFILQPDGTVKSSVVKLGRHFDTTYEILEGVAEGDVVATKGNNALRDGDKVEVVE